MELKLHVRLEVVEVRGGKVETPLGNVSRGHHAMDGSLEGVCVGLLLRKLLPDEVVH